MLFSPMRRGERNICTESVVNLDIADMGNYLFCHSQVVLRSLRFGPSSFDKTLYGIAAIGQ